ncbi:hypothetical protein, variant [Allomyces macrogynus ATCC 38327]|uniref:Uncharacterized protein n=1 Tax=Allomyces macrogynus (strain ATCC 38327) TaxID=578462 RepID=A0A0L0TB59_ALLM3|nr:hypothetical protein, variant [Allomyces macrogynus ATCC 38327]|eukprot:KNE71819.1 hypothetical protein, variant [Allomyces macrogynus ATCC 38327]
MAARNPRASADGGLQADLTRMLDGYLSTLPVHRNAARGGAMPPVRTADDNMTVRLRQLPTAELEKRLAAQRQLHEKIERKIITPPDGGARVVATIAALDTVLAERRGVDDLAYKLASARLDPSATSSSPLDVPRRDVVVLDAPTASAAAMARSPPKWKMPAKVAALSAEETLVYAEEMRKANQQRKIQEQIERLRRGTRNMHLQQLHAASSVSPSSTPSPRASPDPALPYRPTASASATTRPVPHNARYQDDDDDDENESSFDVSDDDLDDGLDLGRDEGGESSAYFSESDDDHGARF